ncbi:MAG: phage major capsid protein [Lachnobacterium sp.]|nr:phage major capsid protein [Lachnobacterium sp.]
MSNIKKIKDNLLKRQKFLEEKRDSLKKRADESENVEEIRSITQEIADVIEELNMIKGEIADLENDGSSQDNNDNSNSEERSFSLDKSNVPENAELRNANVLGKFKNDVVEVREEKDIYSSYEYRKAFMAYAQKGIPIPQQFATRDNAANTNTLGATIPTTLLNEFINEVRKKYGNLFAKVRRLNVKGALRIPIAKLEADFKWISESTVSPRDDAGTFDDYVEFRYNTAEIRVSQTLVSSIVTLDLFEREILEIMMIAYFKAMDRGIVRGTGNGQMLGLLNDPRVLATENVVEFTSTEINDWTEWRKKFFSKLPLGYRDGEFIFPLSTVESYLLTMADNNNNPVFSQATGLEVNDGDSRNPNGRFYGREISLVEPDILPDYDAANNGDVIGIFWQPREYGINTNMEFTMRRYFDEERNEWVNKILTIVDGKVLNPRGIWLIKKKVTG